MTKEDRDPPLTNEEIKSINGLINDYKIPKKWLIEKPIPKDKEKDK